jgi:hypothetical protein
MFVREKSSSVRPALPEACGASGINILGRDWVDPCFSKMICPLMFRNVSHATTTYYMTFAQ